MHLHKEQLVRCGSTCYGLGEGILKLQATRIRSKCAQKEANLEQAARYSGTHANAFQDCRGLLPTCTTQRHLGCQIPGSVPMIITPNN